MVEQSEIKIAGVVLAGGLSRRMNGIDKSLLELRGKTMLAHVIERLDAQVSSLVINANGDPARFADFGYDVLPDMIEGHAGPLAGIHAGLTWGSELDGITHIVTAAADTPFLPLDLVSRLSGHLINQDNETVIFASTQGRLHPVFGLWPVHLGPSLESFLQETENRRVVAFAKQHNLVEASFGKGTDTIDPFFNINTPEDLETAHQHMAQFASGGTTQ